MVLVLLVIFGFTSLVAIAALTFTREDGNVEHVTSRKTLVTQKM